MKTRTDEENDASVGFGEGLWKNAPQLHNGYGILKASCRICSGVSIAAWIGPIRPQQAGVGAPRLRVGKAPKDLEGCSVW